jgi:hypothetical protein
VSAPVRSHEFAPEQFREILINMIWHRGSPNTGTSRSSAMVSATSCLVVLDAARAARLAARAHGLGTAMVSTVGDPELAPWFRADRAWSPETNPSERHLVV